MNINTGLFKDSNCPKQCYFMDDERVIFKSKVDITLLHARDLKGKTLDEVNYASNMNALGTKVLYSIESPLYTSLNGFNKDFIITYQSNFYGLSRKYDHFERIATETNLTEVWNDEQINSAIKSKTKGLLILVSNCDTFSSREYFIEALSQYLPITIYGKCSKIYCNSECEKAAIKEHKFYLAFENSVCNEYVTEKFWRMKDLIVPIVLTNADLIMLYR
uniref:Fucosyltransferase n=1 Tax=Panagrolaimus sp. PS1159 TaxID=55785 RepID=A0AC35G369_9BILA